MSDTITVTATAVPTYTYEKERLVDLLVTALEGGIGYWARAYEYEHSGDDPHALIVDYQNVADELGLDLSWSWQELDDLMDVPLSLQGDVLREHTYRVDLRDLAKTCAKAQAGEYGKTGRFYVQQWLDEDEDATTADVLFQLATLGELTYG